jgi:flagellar biosynthetic protein FlhB
MADQPEKDQKTEAPTARRQQEAAEKGDVLQSRELGTALVMLAGAGWLAVMGPWMMGALEEMLVAALRFDVRAIETFDPAKVTLKLLEAIALPLLALFAITLLAAVGTPAMLGSLGFRWGAVGFKASKMNPLTGIRRIFGMQGLVELVKSMAKVGLLGAVGWWLLGDRMQSLMGLGTQDVVAAIRELGATFVIAVTVMAFALVAVALIDVPAQIVQRGTRLRMSKQEVRDEHKQTEGSPELRAAIRRKQHEVLNNSARQAVREATVVLTNPTHFAVALRYRPGYDAAPIVVARGRGATADAIRAMAGEAEVPMLSYPQLARAVYFTSRTGQIIREDLYVAVAAVIAFVFNLDAAMAQGTPQPQVTVPEGARFDEDGRAVDD